MMIGFYAGSFDPFTNGHLAIVKKACKCFDKVVIGIGHNMNKQDRTNRVEMKAAIEETMKVEDLTNVEVVIYHGLTTEAAIECHAEYLIRGLRNGTDYQYEENIAEINEECSGLDTCYFRAGNLGFLSSSMVIELYTNQKDISRYVPKPVLKVLRNAK